jgi:hypothetical protein
LAKARDDATRVASLPPERAALRAKSHFPPNNMRAFFSFEKARTPNISRCDDPSSILGLDHVHFEKNVSEH